MMHKTWCGVEEVPYCFSRSSIKFQGHTGWKIDNFNIIWVRLLGQTQLSKHSDLPCYQDKTHCISKQFSAILLRTTGHWCAINNKLCWLISHLANHGLYSLSRKASYQKISWRLYAVRLHVMHADRIALKLARNLFLSNFRAPRPSNDWWEPDSS